LRLMELKSARRSFVSIHSQLIVDQFAF
jgi:hypothetical protein